MGLNTMKEWSRRLWCYLFHRHEWTLYGGFSRVFSHCRKCGAYNGDLAVHRQARRGYPFDDCDELTREFAIMNFGLRPDKTADEGHDVSSR